MLFSSLRQPIKAVKYTKDEFNAILGSKAYKFFQYIVRIIVVTHSVRTTGIAFEKEYLAFFSVTFSIISRILCQEWVAYIKSCSAPHFHRKEFWYQLFSFFSNSEHIVRSQASGQQTFGGHHGM